MSEKVKLKHYLNLVEMLFGKDNAFCISQLITNNKRLKKGNQTT